MALGWAVLSAFATYVDHYSWFPDVFCFILPAAKFLDWKIILIGFLLIALWGVLENSYRYHHPKPARVPANPVLSVLETQTFNALKTEFDAMPWVEKLALKLVYQAPIIQVDFLEQQLQNYGYRGAIKNDIITPLTNRALFVKMNAIGEIEKHPLNSQTILELLEGWRKYAV